MVSSVQTMEAAGLCGMSEIYRRSRDRAAYILWGLLLKTDNSHSTLLQMPDGSRVIALPSIRVVVASQAHLVVRQPRSLPGQRRPRRVHRKNVVAARHRCIEGSRGPWQRRFCSPLIALPRSGWYRISQVPSSRWSIFRSASESQSRKRTLSYGSGSINSATLYFHPQAHSARS